MKKGYNKVHVLKLVNFDWRLLIACLNDFRTRLIESGGDTTDVSSLLLKIIDAPQKNNE